MSNKIVETVTVGFGLSFISSSLWAHKVIEDLLETNNKTLYLKDLSGSLGEPSSLDDLKKYLEQKGGRLLINNEDTTFSYVWNDSIIDVVTNKNNSIRLQLVSTNYDIYKLFISLEKFVDKTTKNTVFTIIKTAFGLDYRSMGDASSPLIEDNYSKHVVNDIKYVTEAFSKTPPHGRIVILNGEPGTGKTHLIRSLLSNLECVFLMVPSNMISSLDQPEFLPLLMKIKSEHNKPIAIIIEDGDLCLESRKSDNISTVASLLNLSDGILGNVIDIRFIISTNVYIEDIDAAILRPGRLCKQINVGPLEYEQANKVYKRLMKDESVSLEYNKTYTLAEIYEAVLPVNKSATYEPTQKRIIGFQLNNTDSNNSLLNKR